jgi:hypothetical protein
MIPYLYNWCKFMGHPNHLYPCTVHVWEWTVTILSTLHTRINTFVFKYLPIEAIQRIHCFPIIGRISGTRLLWSSTASPAIQLEFPQFSYLGIGGISKGYVMQGSGWELKPRTLIIKCVEKTKLCDLSPSFNRQRRLFVLFHQGLLPNPTIKGLRPPQIDQL